MCGAMSLMSRLRAGTSALMRTSRPGRALWSRLFVAAVIVIGCIAIVWASRYAYAIQRLTRGVGDTTFFGADGQPWFRMDEQRHDVPLAEIAPDLQHAVIATEDHRF